MHAAPAPMEVRPDRVTVIPARAFDDCLQKVAVHADRVAFAALFEHYAPRVKSLLMRSGSTPAAAEELAQETLLTVWRKARLFDPARASSAAWIFTIARNLRADAQRRGSSSLYAFDYDFGAEPPALPDDLLVHAQDAHSVRAALRGLNAQQAQLIELAFFQDQSHSQISAALGLPLGTVKARIRFGMIKLRAALEAAREACR